MHTPNGHTPEPVDASHGYERSDVRVTGILVFLTALSILVVVTAVLCWGIGKVINTALDHEDGPNTKWTKTADVRQLGNLANNPEIQSKVAQLTQQFPAPRLQNDQGDGAQDIADLHQREDLLLEHYSKIDGSDKVRIPIEQAMALIAKKGLPVASAVTTEKPMTGDHVPTVTAPLTNGFVLTGYEQDEAAKKQAEQVRPEQK
jgi:Na+-transporting methylmalonyl-CoA/oxaloacetate decarboxylase gamma subunit